MEESLRDMSTYNNIIDHEESLIHGLKKMDELQVKSLLVFAGEKFVNIVSIGDIQRAILSNIPLDSSISSILRSDTTLCHINDSEAYIKELMLEKRIECMPIVDDDHNLRQVIYWEDIFQDRPRITAKFDLPIVIMAGGQGTRLRPITNVLPKPLIPLGNKSTLEIIMDSFVKYGSKQFFLSVNYKAELIQYYLDNLRHEDYLIQYIREEKPLGTAGSLYLLKDKINTTFFVSNCDIIIKDDYSEILNYHRQNKNELTIVAALKHYRIPYGTIQTGENGKLTQITEKPEMVFKINSGMYILEPHLLHDVPDNEFYHITDLIEKVRKRGGKVGVYPVSEKSWKDIGQWDEYLKTKDEF